MAYQPASQSFISIRVTTIDAHGAEGQSEPIMGVEATVVPQITDKLPVLPVSCDPHWEHLKDLHLAGTSFGIPAHVDVLLGVDVFNTTVYHG